MSNGSTPQVSPDGSPESPAYADEGSATPLAHAGEGVGTVSVRDAAKQIGVSERTVRRRIQDGALSAWKQETEHGYEWRVPVSSLDAGLPGRPARQVASLPGTDDQGAGRAPTQPVAAMDTPTAPELLKALEMVDRLSRENQQLAGQLGFTQAKLQDAQEENQQLRLLPAPKDEPAPEPAAEPVGVSWWRRWWSS